MGQVGFLEHDETVKGMKLFAREVYPRLKELTPGGCLEEYLVPLLPPI